MMREVIDRVLFIEYMYQYKIVICKKFSSASLTTIEDFDDHKDFEILVIGIYLNRIFDIFEVVMSVLHGFDDSKHFSIVDIIIAFDE